MLSLFYYESLRQGHIVNTVGNRGSEEGLTFISGGVRRQYPRTAVSRQGKVQMRRRRRRYGSRRKEENQNIKLVGNILLWAVQIAAVLLIAFLLVFYGGEQISNIGDSMSPALENGDTVLVNRLIYKLRSPQMGDLVVFKPNGNENSHFYIKRVVGTPGDTVQIIEGFLYVNDELVTDLPVTRISNPGIAQEPVTVEEGCYFVIGDNPDSSEDSRHADVGNVRLEDIEGQPWYILSPSEHRGRLE